MFPMCYYRTDKYYCLLVIVFHYFNENTRTLLFLRFAMRLFVYENQQSLRLQSVMTPKITLTQYSFGPDKQLMCQSFCSIKLTTKLTTYLI